MASQRDDVSMDTESSSEAAAVSRVVTTPPDQVLDLQFPDYHPEWLGLIFILQNEFTKVRLYLKSEEELVDFVEGAMIYGPNDYVKEITFYSQGDVNFAGGGKALACLLLLVPNCTKLDLGVCGLLQEDILALARRGANIEDLRLNESISKLTGHDVGTLLYRLPKCKFLDVSKTGITAASLHKMALSIGGAESPLMWLNLSSNHIDGAGSTLANLCTFSHNTPNLETLQMEGCGLGVRDLEALANGIKGNIVHIESLLLARNHFDGGGKALGEMIYHLSALRKPGTSVDAIDLSQCHLTKDDLRIMVLVTLERPAQYMYKRLNLSGNSFAGGGEFVGTILRMASDYGEGPLETLLFDASDDLDLGFDSETRETAHEGGWKLDLLDVSGCGLTYDDLFLMVGEIKNCKGSIRILDLSQNPLNSSHSVHPDRGDTLAELLRFSTKGECLKLQQCHLMADDIRSAIGAIPENAIHVCVHVAGNDMKEDEEEILKTQAATLGLVLDTTS